MIIGVPRASSSLGSQNSFSKPVFLLRQITCQSYQSGVAKWVRSFHIYKHDATVQNTTQKKYKWCATLPLDRSGSGNDRFDPLRMKMSCQGAYVCVLGNDANHKGVLFTMRVSDSSLLGEISTNSIIDAIPFEIGTDITQDDHTVLQ